MVKVLLLLCSIKWNLGIETKSNLHDYKMMNWILEIMYCMISPGQHIFHQPSLIRFVHFDLRAQTFSKNFSSSTQDFGYRIYSRAITIYNTILSVFLALYKHGSVNLVVCSVKLSSVCLYLLKVSTINFCTSLFNSGKKL